MSSDLFTAKPHAPLAELMRPRTLDEVVGQAELLGPGKPLRLAFASRTPHSMILWGPPGVGKTTLARLMAQAFDAEFIALSAVFSGVKDIREAVQRAELTLAQSGRHTILFVDEVHRFNKAQQDAFLPYVEQGLVSNDAATTENPSFEVISALLSRAAVYVLKSLSEAELGELFERARAQAFPDLEFDGDAKDRLVGLADGDARRLLNLLEIVHTAATTSDRRVVDADFLQGALAKNLRRFDKGGDAFYDQISALHKCIRGTNPDAALYWFCRMLDGGCDPEYIARRLLRAASEDIGNADPRALQVMLDAWQCYERLGSPEGELALAQAVLYLASAPKSNAAYMAYKQASVAVAKGGSEPVPEHLRNAPTKLLKAIGHGRAYQYDHDQPEGIAFSQSGFPASVGEQRYYQPVSRGLEIKIAEKLAWVRDRRAAALAGKPQ